MECAVYSRISHSDSQSQVLGAHGYFSSVTLPLDIPHSLSEKKEEVTTEFWGNTDNVPNTGPNIPVGIGKLKGRFSSRRNGKVPCHILRKEHCAAQNECPPLQEEPA